MMKKTEVIKRDFSFKECKRNLKELGLIELLFLEDSIKEELKRRLKELNTDRHNKQKLKGGFK